MTRKGREPFPFVERIDRRTAAKKLAYLRWPTPDKEEDKLQARIAALAGHSNTIRAMWELWPLREAAFSVVSRRAFEGEPELLTALNAESRDQLNLVMQYFLDLHPAEEPDVWTKDRTRRYATALTSIGKTEDDFDEMYAQAWAAGWVLAKLLGGDEEAIAQIGADVFEDCLFTMSPICTAVRR